MNMTRSLIALVGLLFLLQLSRFSASDFNQVPDDGCLLYRP